MIPITIFSAIARRLMTHCSESVAPARKMAYPRNTKIYSTEGFRADISKIWLVSNTGINAMEYKHSGKPPL